MKVRFLLSVKYVAIEEVRTYARVGEKLNDKSYQVVMIMRFMM